MKVVVRKKTVAPWDPRIPPKLTPSFHGRECLGNGEWPGYECCCDECDHYLACFPEQMEGEIRHETGKIDLIVGNCLANQAMEGLVCTPEDEAACRRIVTGETTLEQELEAVLAKYRKEK